MKQKVTKSSKIRKMLSENKSVADIVKAIPKVKPRDVYVLRYRMKKVNSKGKSQKAGKWETMVQEGEKVIRDIDEEIVADLANEAQVGGEHYKKKNIQPWDAIHEWGLGFFSGNVIKYVARHREKNGVEDLKKARHYLDKLIELMEAK